MEEAAGLSFDSAVGTFLRLPCSYNKEDYKKLLFTLLAESKSRVLEEGLRKTKDASDLFMKTAKKCLASYSGGEAATALQSLPIVHVAIKQHRTLVMEIEDLRSYQGAYTDRELIFTSSGNIGFDPNRLFQTRAAVVIQAANASVVNKLHQITSVYQHV